jgi:hypothetical protein
MDGSLKLKTHILFYGEKSRKVTKIKSWPFGLRQMKFGTVKDHGYT